VSTTRLQPDSVVVNRVNPSLPQRHAHPGAWTTAGTSLRELQEGASHADPRTTMRYDRARGSLDRHATYIVTAYVEGAAR